MTLQQEATAQADATLVIDKARIVSVRDRLTVLQTDITAQRDALDALLKPLDVENPPQAAVDAVIAALDAAAGMAAGLVERGSLFAIRQSRGASIADQARRTFSGLITELNDRVTRFDTKLAACKVKLDAYEALPGDATDEQKTTLLRQAEVEVTTLAPLQAATIAALATAVKARRDQFRAKRDAFANLTRTANRSLAALMQSPAHYFPSTDSTTNRSTWRHTRRSMWCSPATLPHFCPACSARPTSG